MNKKMTIGIVLVGVVLIAFGIYYFGFATNNSMDDYKIYRLLDPNSNPETFTYEILSVKSKVGINDKVKAIIGKLKEETTYSSVPKDAKLLDVTFRDDTGGKIVVLNFDNKFIENFPGGSFGERMMVDTITNSVTEIGGIIGVIFNVNGSIVNADSAHFMYDEPFIRNIDEYTVIPPESE